MATSPNGLWTSIISTKDATEAHGFISNCKMKASHVGRKRVIRLMKQEQLAAHHTTHRVVTTHADPAATPAENVLDRAFEAEQPE